jgi:NADH-quinone oxidoreductase subunit G
MIGERLGYGAPAASAVAVMADIARDVPQYAGITYSAMARVEAQWPDVGGEDLYYGGTAFQNRHGLGVQWAAAAEDGQAGLSVRPAEAGAALEAGGDRLVVVPITVVYDAEPVLDKTELLHGRVPAPHVGLNPVDAHKLGLGDGDMLEITANGRVIVAAARIDGRVPQGVATMPRRLQPQGTPSAATVAQIGKLERVGA